MEPREGTNPTTSQLQQAAAHQTQPVCLSVSLHAKAAATRGQCDHMNLTQLLAAAPLGNWDVKYKYEVVFSTSQDITLG